MKKLFLLILSAIIITSCSACTGNSQVSSTPDEAVATTTASQNIETDNVDWVDYKEYSFDENAQAKNVILMIGDGMGENIIKAAEIVKGDKLIMSGLPNSTHVTTYSQSVAEGKAEFTDSAASSTAMSTGVKTYNHYIGVDKDGNKLETICEFAKKLGMKTGLVDRHYVSHATPAGMAGHDEYRGNYRPLLRDMAETGVDVMLGGGEKFYSESNATRKAIELCGYSFINTEDELLNLNKDSGKILGMFAYDNMKRVSLEPTLTTMTAKTLELLDNENGFFLMVEGSNIDVCESDLDMDGTIEQMKGFDHTVNYVLDWASKHPGTLVLVTADHETGGVTLPENATASDINNDCFTSGGEHTNTNVKLMAGGAQSKGICETDLIDNTDIAKYMRKVLNESHGN